MFRVLGTALAALTLLLAGCREADRPARNLVLCGSRTMGPLVADVAARFRKARPDVRINIELCLTEPTLAATRTGLADVGLLGRRLRPNENGLVARTLARDGIAVVVHRSNPVQSLSEAQLAGIFARTLTTWKDVGGTDQPIRVIAQAEGYGLREAFLEQLGLQGRQLRADDTVATSDLAVQAVAQRPSAISFASLGVAEAAAKTLPVRLLAVNGVPATTANLRAGTYRLTRPLLLLTREAPAGVVRELIDFACSTEVADLIEKHGFALPSP
jgi:phosphate transport system substrate-binding protein